MNCCTMKKYFGDNEQGLFGFQLKIKTPSTSTKDRVNVDERTLLMVFMILIGYGVLIQRA